MYEYSTYYSIYVYPSHVILLSDATLLIPYFCKYLLCDLSDVSSYIFIYAEQVHLILINLYIFSQMKIRAWDI